MRLSPLVSLTAFFIPTIASAFTSPFLSFKHTTVRNNGWIQDGSGEWEWEEDDPTFASLEATTATATATTVTTAIDGIEALKVSTTATATPTLPSGSFRPKQSLGQNFLKDGNTVLKIIRSFVSDASETTDDGVIRAVELGPGAGALTDQLVKTLDTSQFQCIEIDGRSVQLLQKKHPNLEIVHEDVLQVDYPTMANEQGGPLSIIGNLPYYITSQILFALADASHYNAIQSATVTMQYEVAQRMVAQPKTKAYGILSVVFQIYADCKLHFKISPTVFYPQPKVQSALVGLHFIGPAELRTRLGGVQPSDLRKVLKATFQQRRKTLKNTVKTLLKSENIDTEPIFNPSHNNGEDENASTYGQESLPNDWTKKRPEELTPGQFVALTKLIYGGDDNEKAVLGRKVWRKVKHGI